LKGWLRAHRRTADAAGIECKSAVYRKIGEEVIAGRGLTIERMVELARVSRASFYRFSEEAKPDRDMDLSPRPARCHPAYRVAVAQLWTTAHPCGTAAAWMDGVPNDRSSSLGCWTVNPKRAYWLLQRGQPALRAQVQVRRHHRLQSRAEGLPEPGSQHGADRRRSTLAGRYHLCPAAR